MPRSTTATSRDSWPDPGPQRDLLEYLDRIREDNGRKSVDEVGREMGFSKSRVSDILTAARGARPADEDQVRRLARALGGGEDEAAEAARLFKRMKKAARARQLPASTPAVRYTPGTGLDFVPRKPLAAAYEQVKATGAALVVLAGPPGSGKTALARQLSSRGGVDPGRGQLLRCGTDQELERSLRSVLPLRARRYQSSLGQLEDSFRAYLRDREPPLQPVILDDVRDEAVLRRLLPEGVAGDYIVTSRSRLRSVDPAAQIDVGPMSSDEAQELMRRRAGQQAAGSAGALAAAAGNNPLALEAICGALSQSTDADPAELAAEMAAHAAVLLDRPDRYGNPGLTAAYRATCRALGEQDPMALWMLGLIAFSASGPLESAILLTALQKSGPRPIPGRQVARAVARQCVSHLESIYLVRPAGDRRAAVEMHDLTRLLIREILSADKPGLVSDLHNAVLDVLSQLLVADRSKAEVLKLFPQLLYFARHIVPEVQQGNGRTVGKSLVRTFKQYLQVSAKILAAIGADPAEYILISKPSGPDQYSMEIGALDFKKGVAQWSFSLQTADMRAWAPDGDHIIETLKTSVQCAGPNGPCRMYGIAATYRAHSLCLSRLPGVPAAERKAHG